MLNRPLVERFRLELEQLIGLPQGPSPISVPARLTVKLAYTRNHDTIGLHKYLHTINIYRQDDAWETHTLIVLSYLFFCASTQTWRCQSTF